MSLSKHIYLLENYDTIKRIRKILTTLSTVTISENKAGGDGRR